MDSAASLQLINDLEGAFPVSSWQLCGVNVWPMVRGELWWSVNDDYRPLRTRVRAASPLTRRTEQLVEWPTDLARWASAQRRRGANRDSLRRPADAVLMGDGVSRVPIEGRWLDRLTDPFVDALDTLGRRSLQLDLNRVYRVPTYRPSVHVQPIMDALWLRNRALPARGPLAELDGYDGLLAELRARGVELPAISPPVVFRQARQLRAVTDWFGRLLDRAGARLGLLVDHGLVPMAFNRACAERGIPSIEIQHGVQIGNGRYTAWNALPPGGYPELPSHFWCWSEAEAANIRAWGEGSGRHEPITGGNLWLRTWLEDESPVVARQDALVAQTVPGDPRELEILVTLSTGFSSEDALRAVREAIAVGPQTWRWWVRSHPTMEADEFDFALAFLRGAGDRDVVRNDAHELPLYALLRRVDVHVSQVSTTGIEAEQFGVPSVMTDPVAAELFPEQFARGWLVGAHSGAEVAAAVRGQAERRDRLPAPSDPRALGDPADLLRPLLGPETGPR